MAPKNKGKAKEQAAEPAAKGGKAGKLKPATSINVRHILCEKHSKKEEALEKLRKGAKFDDVAREMSEDKARQGEWEMGPARPNCILITFVIGGSLGWKTRGSLLADFEKVAYELEPSTTNSPKWGECKTSEGYHIIMVEGRK